MNFYEERGKDFSKKNMEMFLNRTLTTHKETK